MQFSTQSLQISQEVHSAFFAENVRSRTQLVPTDIWLEVVLGLDAGIRSRFDHLVIGEGFQSDPVIAASLRKIQNPQSEPEAEDDALGTLTAQVLEKFKEVESTRVFVRLHPSAICGLLTQANSTLSLPAQ